jgi:hypothetical protein
MEEQDSDYFFRREQETVEVLKALAATPRPAHDLAQLRLAQRRHIDLPVHPVKRQPMAVGKGPQYLFPSGGSAHA